MFYNVVSNEYLSRLSFFLLLFERMNGISANRRAEGQVQCQFRGRRHIHFNVNWTFRSDLPPPPPIPP